MNTLMPRRLVQALDLAPKEPLYQKLQRLGLSDARPNRSVEWCWEAPSGDPIVTLWDLHIREESDGVATCAIPAGEWLDRSDLRTRSKALRLLTLLRSRMGGTVRVLVCEHDVDDQSVKIKRSMADTVKWKVVSEYGDRVVLLMRMDRYFRDRGEAS